MLKKFTRLNLGIFFYKYFFYSKNDNLEFFKITVLVFLYLKMKVVLFISKIEIFIDYL